MGDGIMNCSIKLSWVMIDVLSYMCGIVVD